MIKALIIDDESSACEVLSTLLEEYCPNVQILGAITDPELAVTKITELKPQLLFLDINMPNKDGFAMLENFKEPDFVVIFVTAYNQYVLHAMRNEAIDYLLKPVDVSDLIKSIHRAEKRIEEKTYFTMSQIKNISHNSARSQTIAIANSEGFEFIQVHDIVRIEADATYSKFFLKNGRTIFASKNIGDFETQLPQTMFCRIHHAHIINLNEVRKYVRGRGGYVILTDDTKVDVADRKKEDFLAKISSQ